MIFAVVKENNHLRNVGTAIGFNNMACVAGGALFQPLVGIILNLHGSGVIHDGVPVYSVADFRIGLTIIPACYLISAITSAYFMKETYCKQIDN